MRPLFPLLLVALGLGTSATSTLAQQIACPGADAQATSVSGVVYAPNGVDPLPNVTVYVPTTAVDPFTPGVSCPVVGQAPSGTPLVGTVTATDGSFTIKNMPVGTNIPLVIVSGRWRRQITISTVTACVNTPLDKTQTHFPTTQAEGDIPKIAIVTGSADSVECVLRKVGIADSEFTNNNGSGRITLYAGAGSAGATIPAAGTQSAPQTEVDLMSSATNLNNFDVLMLPCQGGQYNKPDTTGQPELSNLVSFANGGGRVYASHFSYVWMYNKAPFNSVVNWAVGQTAPPDGVATVDTTFSAGATLADWLQLVGATTTKGQMAISTLKHDFNGVNRPTQSWLKLNNASFGNPVMQFVFDTPVGATTNQCGRVLYNEYHVENPTIASAGKTFPAECPTTAMSPQEKLLEYSLFELTDDGGSATMTPSTADFGSEPVGFTTGPQYFTWTNNSTFSSGVSLLNTTGDFVASSTNCSSVTSGSSCTISVVFAPSALGPRTGTLSVGSGAQTLTASLTGIGTPGLSTSPASLTFGNVDVNGGTQTLTVTVTNNAPGGLALPAIVTTGDYSATTNCPSTVAAVSSCTIFVKFAPTATGTRTGTVALSATTGALTTNLTGNGVDFSIAVSPTSGTVIAGIGTTTTVTMKPIAGFTGTVSLTCSVTASGSTCTPSASGFDLTAGATATVTITTTPKYSVIGYGGFGNGALLLLTLGSAAFLWTTRKRHGSAARMVVTLIALAAGGLFTTGCSGKLPDVNVTHTEPGDYTYTLTATDGIITHSATFALHVTTK